MKKTNTPKDAPPVLQMAEVETMTQPERIALFKSKDQSHSRITVELGKLLLGMRAAMKDPSQATALLKKQGIRPGTVNAASETARVYAELVQSGHMTEAAFDKFGVADIRAVNRVMSGVSAKRMTAADVADLIAACPRTYGEELESFFAHGLCSADKITADKQAAAAKAIAPESSTTSEPSTGEPAAPAPIPATTESGTTAPGTTPAPDPAVEPEAEAPPENVVPSGIAPKSASTASKLAQTLNLLDALELMFADLTVEDARKAYPRLVDLANTVGEFTASTPEEQKAAAKKAA